MARYDTPSIVPTVAVSMAGALLLYVILWPVVMQDIGNDYIPWLQHIVATGPIASFSAPFGSYNPPYLYLLALVSPLYGIFSGATLIKLVSLMGTLALAAATFHLLRECKVRHPARWAALILLMPTTALNTALLGQVDAMWAAPCVVALSAALGRRHSAMLFWCGVAVAFKIQAILFAPFVVALLINRRVAVWKWTIVPIVFVASLLPALALGWPAADLAGIYFRQVDDFPQLSLNAPNIWFIVQTLLPGAAQSLTGLAMATAIGVTGCYIAYFSVRMPAGTRAVPVALLALLITAGLMPYMHERYFYLADVVAIIWAATSADRRAWPVAILVQAGSLLAVLAYATGLSWLVDLGFALMAIATTLVAVSLLKPAANDNPLIARTV